jgi:hypothetical protein
MAIFTVHIPPTAAGARPEPERIVFLRDGFSWPAFFFGPFWLVWRRAWLAAGLWTLLLVIVALIAWKLRVPRDAMSWAGLALAAWLGFEGVRLVAWSLARRGYVERDIVVGDDVEEAEEVFFHRWSAPAEEQEKAVVARELGV